MTKKVKKKRLNLKRVLFFLLLLYIIGYLIYYFINQPIKHISISGNNLIKDNEIIELANLKDYPSIFKYTSRKIEKNIKKHKLINDVNVKKTFGFTIKIDIIENKLLFYYINEDKIVLSNGNIIENNIEDVYGIPTLVNSVEKDFLIKFIGGFSELESNIIYEMDEIYYEPSISETGEILESNRFKIIMNDGNTIITNSNNVSLLNKYNDIYASLGGKSGTIILDSDKISNLIFIPYES